MTEVFDSVFHRKYVGGVGEVKEKPLSPAVRENVVSPISYEDVLHEYRVYVRDPEAELPEEILRSLSLSKKRTDNDRE